MTARSAALVAAVALIFGGIARADAPPAPVRHLVYTFTDNTTQTIAQHQTGISSSDGAGPLTPAGSAAGSLSGSGAASGISETKSAVEDSGTIAVDVVRVERDSGLMVAISEQAHDTRSSRPTTCVVYGNTNVVCEPGEQINSEEYVLLRFLGTTFVDPAQIDAKGHWRVEQSGPTASSVADFSIVKNDAGIVHIASLRVLKTIGAQGYTAASDGTIVYDVARRIPTAIAEDEAIHRSGGVDGYTTVRTQTTLALATDSAASKP